MAEVLFILVTLYVVYVVHMVTSENKEKTILKRPFAETQVIEKKKKKVLVNKEKTAIKKIKQKKDKQAQTITKMPAGNLRDPDTGEEVKIASSYRMLRRWIKEALVKEGFLEKVYKTNELDEAVNDKINYALDQLKQMKKYQ